MSATPSGSALAPFQVKSFRFQWPADLCASFAFEMESIILAWYVLVETKSVFMLSLFVSMNHIGTLLGPILGVVGDRVGQRNMLTAMRGIYSCTAATLLICALTGVLNPIIVLLVAAVTGMVRPSDIGMRNAVISEIMPPNHLLSAAGIQRTTQDSARIFGALTGAGVVAVLGMAPAYVAICALYVSSMMLTRHAGRVRIVLQAGAAKIVRASPWLELKQGMVYVWNTPHLRGIMALALVLNATAFPIFMSLLPYVAKEVYHADQTTLGFLVASGSCGALLGSVLVSRFSSLVNPARMMIFGASGWFVMLIVFAQMTEPLWGSPALFFAGMSQASCLVPMTAILLRNTAPQYRGRVMGIRMLMIYSNMPGILLFAPLVTTLGYTPTATIYCASGLVCALLITYSWREHFWHRGSLTNAR